MSTPAPRTLVAWCDDLEIGRLEERNGAWAFAYAASWIASPSAVDLAPSLPRYAGTIADDATRRPVQWYFDNLLPEEGARQLLARDAGLDGADAFALLAWYGRESAGLLTLLPENERPAPTTTQQALPAAALSARIRALPRLPLTHGAPKKFSMAGAQHKLPVILDAQGALHEPVGATPSTHLLKPEHPDVEAYPSTVANEWFVMSLAGRAGLPVPEVHLLHVPEPVYVVKRFDRAPGSVGTRRLPVLDACQLLALDKVHKYTQARPATVERLTEACRARAATRVALFRWVVFNLLVGNDDAHLKNLSFLAKPGAEGDEYSLAPHYDLLSTAIYHPNGRWADAEPAWPMGDAKRAADVTRAGVLGFAAAIGLPPAQAERELDGLVARVTAEAAAMLEALPDALAEGDRRVLRTIVFGVIRGMAAQLRAPAG